ncbi:hypothetical protein D9758_002176 [Tetrapyrgos nigripes]|uniref:Uncharacterized protein n=1 Tax=Tetrapyrgos nigripes TaxID=182062 RepID=A0A8H5LSX8_9AGAR|nr:hypothetical protein D9758_002176 [Tetrapyrgos nigripes]
MLRTLLSCVALLLAILFYARSPSNENTSLPATYLVPADPSLIRFSVDSQTKNRVADTTAVILNWSRKPNVIRIASSLCTDSLLEDTIALVYIWNNSPNQLSRQDFPLCPENKLRIYNSPSNLYFQARFIACTEATTPFCFIQDDDYFILPEVLSALRSRYSLEHEAGIHLLPPHEALSSHLKRIRVDSKIHTGFAWLGHGAIIQRNHAVQFLSLLNLLNASVEELKMADNYFTLLSNTFPEIWFDQGIELGGGQPFTVGEEGNERNRRHIMRATHMLQQIFDCSQPPCIGGSDPPYLILEESSSAWIGRAPCLGCPCVLETSISLLPGGNTQFDASSVTELLGLEARNLRSLGDSTREFLNKPLSHAVDGNPVTAFCTSAAKKDDFLLYDLLNPAPQPWDSTELVILTDSPEVIMKGWKFEVNFINGQWVSLTEKVYCTSVFQGSSQTLHECHIQAASIAISKFRLTFHIDTPKRFCIHELWIRGRRELR